MIRKLAVVAVLALAGVLSTAGYAEAGRCRILGGVRERIAARRDARRGACQAQDPAPAQTPAAAPTPAPKKR